MTVAEPMECLTAYFRLIAETYSQIHKAGAEIVKCLDVAGHTIRLNFANPTLFHVFFPALAHLQTTCAPENDWNNSLPPQVTFYLGDTVSSGVYPPPPPFLSPDYRRYGQRALKDDDQHLLLHDFANQFLFGYDRAAHQGFFWSEDASGSSIYERAAPLQTLFHWALREFGWQIIHAAALGVEAGGVLLVGNTGAGKSTTALACLQNQQLRYLSDDKCLVSLDPTPRAFGIFNSAKLKTDMLEHLAHFRPLVAGQDEVYKAGKHLLYLYPAYRQQMLTQFPIKAILMPQITHGTRPSITPVSPAQVLSVLGPSTVIWLPGAEVSSLHLITRLAKSVPCYALQIARNPVDNLDLIATTLQNHL